MQLQRGGRLQNGTDRDINDLLQVSVSVSVKQKVMSDLM